MKDGQVIDLGSEYKFVPEYTTRDLPGGIYYPKLDNNGEFILVEKVGDEDEEEFEERTAGPDDEQKIIESINFPPEQGRAHVVESPDSEVEEFAREDLDWVNESYFPLENYNSGLGRADEVINDFINSKEYYEENNIDYRRSLLFFGDPGTGKSQYIMNKTNELVHYLNAVVLRVESHSDIEIMNNRGVRSLSNNIPGRMKVIVFEELAHLIEEGFTRQYVVNILDSAELRDNILFIATTNHPSDLPKNLVDRPGRLDFLIHVDQDDNDPEYVPKFYKHLMGEEYPVDDEAWTEEICEELTPAYMKELFINSRENNESLEETYSRIQDRRELIENEFESGPGGIGF